MHHREIFSLQASSGVLPEATSISGGTKKCTKGQGEARMRNQGLLQRENIQEKDTLKT